MSAQVEVWHVSTVEGIFETDLDTLKQWIAEGHVLPTDKVTKGDLSWIDAGHAPMLRGAFNGEVIPVAPPQADTNQAQPAGEASPASVEPASFEHSDSAAAAPAIMRASPLPAASLPAEACYNHPEVAASYLCRMCAAMFCEECPKFVSASKIPICPVCGDCAILTRKSRLRPPSRQRRGGAGHSALSPAVRAIFRPGLLTAPLHSISIW